MPGAVPTRICVGSVDSCVGGVNGENASLTSRDSAVSRVSSVRSLAADARGEVGESGWSTDDNTEGEGSSEHACNDAKSNIRNDKEA